MKISAETVITNPKITSVTTSELTGIELIFCIWIDVKRILNILGIGDFPTNDSIYSIISLKLLFIRPYINKIIISISKIIYEINIEILLLNISVKRTDTMLHL